MPQDEAKFDFEKFSVRVKYIGEQEGPAYETVIEAPGYEPAYSGVVLNRLPLFSSAAKAAISEFRRLLAEGVKAFLDDYRKNSGIVSFKAVQEMRLTLLSWHDIASAIGDAAMAAAEAELKTEEARESKEVYGKEQEESQGLPEADFSYDLGSVVMDVRQMGVVGIFPLWAVTATVTGTDLHANTILGVQSPLPAHAVQSMVENLKAVFKLGIDQYFVEVPRISKDPVTPERRVGTEMLYAVATAVGASGLEMAEIRAQQEADRERTEFLEHANTSEENAIASMEAEIAERKQLLRQRKSTR